MTLRALIVDDEPLGRERVRQLLAAEEDVEVVGECGHGGEAVVAIEELAPDLVFLDVQMPELDGFGVVEAVGPERMPVTVFVTAYEEFALRAFEASALDYLLKPFDRARFRQALERVREQLRLRRDGELRAQLSTLLAEIRPRRSHLERLVVRSGGRIRFVRVDEVDWFEAEGNYVRVHVGERSHLVRQTMSGLEAELDPARFVRIHRSTIAAVDRIEHIEPLFQGEYAVVLRGGRKLTSSRGYRERLHEALGLS
ncbi:MAG TPA: LytTR family DNA-binding domain-containing protein [Longimicrobiaceae bacterium]|nr:LytTR family DNA-binding domain-containing protein [Longimicrobiaceae bacterium]